MSLKNFHHVVLSCLIVFLPNSIFAAENATSQQPSFLESLVGAMAESLVILKEELSTEVAATDSANAAAAVAAVTAATSTLFKGFENCQISREATQVLEIIREEGVPYQKEDGAWTYPANTGVLGMKTHSLSLGVCDTDGNAECGASSYLSFAIDMPFPFAKQHLIRTYGIDFTKEKRSSGYNDGGQTERPILTRDNVGNTILYCDAGGF